MLIVNKMDESVESVHTLLVCTYFVVLVFFFFLGGGVGGNVV